MTDQGIGLSRRAALLSGSAAILVSQLAQAAPDDLASLTAQVADVEAVRAIKRLQHAWAQYAEAQRWNEMASLFARSGTVILPPETVSGHAAIVTLYKNRMGGGDRPNPNRLNVRFVLAPVINVAADGKTAKGRWHEVAMVGTYGQDAAWLLGIFENDYVLEDGMWKIATQHYYPQAAGPAETGWTDLSNDVKLVPFHYDADGAGRPTIINPPDRHDKAASAGALAARLDTLIDESLVQNLQSAYGFYVTDKMWDDVADLFTADGTLSIDGQGTYKGPQSIRRGLDRFGPANLHPHELNDHLELMPVIEVAADGRSATARGIELAMTCTSPDDGRWGINIYESRFIKDGGKWKIAGIHIMPRLLAAYDIGWARDLPAMAGASSQFPPDVAAKPVSTAYPASPGPAPAFASPVRPRSLRKPEAGAGVDAVARKLAVARAYDGAENVATAYGYYIDESLWTDAGNLFALKGWKELSYVGTYVGRDRVTQSMIARYGTRSRPPTGLTLHQKVQPYVTVSDDGRKIAIRLFLFQLNSGYQRPGSYTRGRYEDEVILENGIYKIFGMDLDYAWDAGYRGGWAKAPPGSAQRARPANVLAKYPPDGPLRGNVFAPFPEVSPVSYHFNNPVSGRPPGIFLPWTEGAPHG